MNWKERLNRKKEMKNKCFQMNKWNKKNIISLFESMVYETFHIFQILFYLSKHFLIENLEISNQKLIKKFNYKVSIAKISTKSKLFNFKKMCL